LPEQIRVVRAALRGAVVDREHDVDAQNALAIFAVPQ
jgi:hypothetical protein